MQVESEIRGNYGHFSIIEADPLSEMSASFVEAALDAAAVFRLTHLVQFVENGLQLVWVEFLSQRGDQR